MIVKYLPQISRKKFKYSFKGEKVAVSDGSTTLIYDLKDAPESGKVIADPLSGLPVLQEATKKDGVLCVSLIYPIPMNADPKEKYPAEFETEDVKKLPTGEKANIEWEEAAKKPDEKESEASPFMAAMFQGMIALDRASGADSISDTMILESTEYFSYPEFEDGRNYKKGEIIQKEGLFYEIVADHKSIVSAYPVETTFGYYRLIELKATGTKDDPIPYPENVTVVKVEKDKYYSYKGKVYLAKADMPDCVWPPDSVGLWQWALVV